MSGSVDEAWTGSSSIAAGSKGRQLGYLRPHTPPQLATLSNQKRQIAYVDVAAAEE
jgi:hypothetical protein